MAAMERGEPREEWMKAQAPPPTDQSTFHLMKIFKWFQPTARAFKVRFLHKCFMPLQCHLMLLKCCHPLALLLSATPKRRVIPRMTSKWQHWGEQRAVDSMKKQRGKGEKKGEGGGGGKYRGLRWGEGWKGQNTVFISRYKIFIVASQEPNWPSQWFKGTFQRRLGCVSGLRHDPVGPVRLYRGGGKRGTLRGTALTDWETCTTADTTHAVKEKWTHMEKKKKGGEDGGRSLQ